jgi:hypothetical protein
MTHQIIRLARGKETLIDEGSRPKMLDRLKQLRSSTRSGVSGRTGNKYSVTYKIITKET